jgi:hypothetical protein
MDGIHYFSGWAYNSGGDQYTVTNHWEVPPLNCIVQTSIVGMAAFDTEGNALIAITSAQYLDSNGVTRTDDFGNPPWDNSNPVTSIYYGSLVRFDWALQVANAWGNYIMNVFEWGPYV